MVRAFVIVSCVAFSSCATLRHLKRNAGTSKAGTSTTSAAKEAPTPEGPPSRCEGGNARAHQVWAPWPEQLPQGVVRQGNAGEVFVGTIVNGRREGPAHLYDLSGQWDQSGTYRAGVKHGPWDSFRAGLPESRCDWVDGHKTGVCVLLDACGGEVGRDQYLADVLDGPSLHLHANGLKEQEATYIRGVYMGSFRSWHLNGLLKEEGTYDAGQKVGLWRTWFDNGQLATEAGQVAGAQAVDRSWFRDGVRERETQGDVARTWFHTGVIASEHNVQPGVSTGYFPSGSKKSESAGAVTTYWYDNGQVFMRVEHGAAGEVVSLKRWDESGAPISDEEWARQNAARAERWKVLGKALEVPASLLLYGLK